MILNIGLFSYGAAAASFLVLSLLLFTSWRGHLQGALLVWTSVVTVVWAVAAAVHAWSGYQAMVLVPLLEVVRNAFWFLFLLKLLQSSEAKSWFTQNIRYVTICVLGFCIIIAGQLVYPLLISKSVVIADDPNSPIYSQLMLAIIGLVLVEQLFRNVRQERRWAVKHLCLGVGGMFAYDIYLYSDALLFNRIDMSLWEARGVVVAFIVPLISVSAARNRTWAVDVFVSRGIVFHTATLLSAGIYLLAMAAGGYYIRFYGGSWGGVAQAVFLFGAIIMLFIIMFSGHMRARMNVFINKHFFNYKYDYREEWLRFNKALSTAVEGRHLYDQAICAIAEIVDSPGGILWSRQDSGSYLPVAQYSLSDAQAEPLQSDSSLIKFIDTRNWVIDINEYRHKPLSFPGLELPAWLESMKKAWLIVPIKQHEGLLGIMVIEQSRAKKSVNWEDYDLLKTAACQAGSYLSQLEMTQALISARQFETFNKLSAFVVHDLSNLVSQLSLIVANAARNKDNPEFQEDMIATIDHSVAKMNRLLNQLRAGRVSAGPVVDIDLNALLREIIDGKAAEVPKPILLDTEHGIVVMADRDRLTSVFRHLIQNAQDATPGDGQITVSLAYDAGHAVIDIKDNGCGMDAEFIRERLFRPFDSTKGGSGMGIGAYESREFVREFDGEIGVTSEPGIGTTFHVSLPATRDNRPERKA